MLLSPKRVLVPTQVCDILTHLSSYEVCACHRWCCPFRYSAGDCDFAHTGLTLHLREVTLALRNAAMRDPLIMHHSKYQEPHDMLRDVFKKDPVVVGAFGLRSVPALPALGLSNIHVVKLTSSEEVYRRQIPPLIKQYLSLNRSAYETIMEFHTQWRHRLPQDMQGKSVSAAELFYELPVLPLGRRRVSCTVTFQISLSSP